MCEQDISDLNFQGGQQTIGSEILILTPCLLMWTFSVIILFKHSTLEYFLVSLQVLIMHGHSVFILIMYSRWTN